MAGAVTGCDPAHSALEPLAGDRLWKGCIRRTGKDARTGVRGRLTSGACEAVEAALTSNASTIITHALNPGLLPLQTRSERPLFHDITVTPVGHPPAHGCLVYIADVTMATKREQFLRSRQNARYDAVVARAADVILTVDDAGIIQLANPAATTQFGYAADDLLGRPAAGLSRSAVGSTVAGRAGGAFSASLQNGYPPRDATCYIHGGLCNLAQRHAHVRHRDPRDISQRRATEAALRLRETEARPPPQPCRS